VINDEEEPGAEVADLAAAVRRLVDLMLRVDENDPSLIDLITELDAMSAELESAQAGADPFENARAGEWLVPRHDPVSGVENALAPPIVMELDEDGKARAELVFGIPYQGPKGIVHGGISAMVLDHVLSVAERAPDQPLVTAELSFRYESPLPLFEQAQLTAHRVSVEGRKVRVAGEIRVNDQVAVSAEGLFIAKRLDLMSATTAEGASR
jgi:acyl-coenzyme A thioesterase PaaI-like protein